MPTKTKLKLDCCYSEKCTDADSTKCLSCQNNNKRSYYRQDPAPLPYIYPIYPTWPWDWVNPHPTWEPLKIEYGTTCEEFENGTDTAPTVSYYTN